MSGDTSDEVSGLVGEAEDLLRGADDAEAKAPSDGGGCVARGRLRHGRARVDRERACAEGQHALRASTAATFALRRPLEEDLGVRPGAARSQARGSSRLWLRHGRSGPGIGRALVPRTGVGP